MPRRVTRPTNREESTRRHHRCVGATCGTTCDTPTWTTFIDDLRTYDPTAHSRAENHIAFDRFGAGIDLHGPNHIWPDEDLSLDVLECCVAKTFPWFLCERWVVRGTHYINQLLSLSLRHVHLSNLHHLVKNQLISLWEDEDFWGDARDVEELVRRLRQSTSGRNYLRRELRAELETVPYFKRNVVAALVKAFIAHETLAPLRVMVANVKVAPQITYDDNDDDDPIVTDGPHGYLSWALLGPHSSVQRAATARDQLQFRRRVRFMSNCVELWRNLNVTQWLDILYRIQPTRRIVRGRCERDTYSHLYIVLSMFARVAECHPQLSWSMLCNTRHEQRTRLFDILAITTDGEQLMNMVMSHARRSAELRGKDPASVTYATLDPTAHGDVAHLIDGLTGLANEEYHEWWDTNIASRRWFPIHNALRWGTVGTVRWLIENGVRSRVQECCYTRRTNVAHNVLSLAIYNRRDEAVLSYVLDMRTCPAYIRSSVAPPIVDARAVGSMSMPMTHRDRLVNSLPTEAMEDVCLALSSSRNDDGRFCRRMAALRDAGVLRAHGGAFLYHLHHMLPDGIGGDGCGYRGRVALDMMVSEINRGGGDIGGGGGGAPTIDAFQVYEVIVDHDNNVVDVNADVTPDDTTTTSRAKPPLLSALLCTDRGIHRLPLLLQMFFQTPDVRPWLIDWFMHSPDVRRHMLRIDLSTSPQAHVLLSAVTRMIDYYAHHRTYAKRQMRYMQIMVNEWGARWSTPCISMDTVVHTAHYALLTNQEWLYAALSFNIHRLTIDVGHSLDMTKIHGQYVNNSFANVDCESAVGVGVDTTCTSTLRRIVQAFRLVRRIVRRYERKKRRAEFQRRRLLCTHIAFAPRNVLPCAVVGHEFLKREAALLQF